jgi:hypothetical protein
LAINTADEVKRSGKPDVGIAAYKKVLDLARTITKPTDDVHSK